jgi:8-oxo-dGTP pyrophosphatase MutT (NUDIX family)
VPAPAASDPVDRVDDQDRPLGTVLRGKVYELGANFRTAHIFVTDDRGLLMLQRTGPAHRHPGLLGSSAAGYLHRGESYEAAARRRLAEEVDLHGPLADVGKIAVPDRGVTKFVRLFSSPLADALPRIVDTGHVAALEFHDIGDLEQRLAAEPETFTPTFAPVFGLYLAEQP